MIFNDLRAFIDFLEKNGELKRVAKPVDPKFELGAICRKVVASQGPALYLEKLNGSDIPVLTNLLATRRRVAMALGCEEQEILNIWLERTEKAIQPELVASGPCQQVVKTDDFDITRFPVPILWSKGDGGPYITFGISVCKDPKTGISNAGIYRMHIKGPKKIGANLHPNSHAGICLGIAESLGRPLEFALVSGVDPVTYIASLGQLDFNEDEFALAGSLRGSPLPLVKCKTVDLEVPAEAEIVMEGKLLPDVREVEGPFGEWTGYVSGAAPKPVFEISCITHRKDPIYVTTYEGYPTIGVSTTLQAVGREAIWLRRISSYSCPTVKDVHFTDGGLGALHVVVSIKKHAEGQAKNIICDLLRSPSIKHVVLVDDDIDARDMKMVEWAIATRVQADQDVTIMPAMAGMRLDPSQPAFPSGLGAKMGIDATKPLAKEFPPLVESPKEVMDMVEAQWDSYGI